MRTFIVHSSEYLTSDAVMRMIKAKDLRDLVEQIGFLDDENTCGHCGGLITEALIVKQFREINGGGQAFHTIKEVITELDGIKLVEVPELNGKEVQAR